jgi:hypothetical protein
MHKNATKCNETIYKWCKNKHGASKIIDTFETYQSAPERNRATVEHLLCSLVQRRSARGEGQTKKTTVGGKRAVYP